MDVNSEIKRLEKEKIQRDVPFQPWCDLPCIRFSRRGWVIGLIGAGVLWFMSSPGILSAGALWPMILLGCGLLTLAVAAR